jgi:hypothetical protein
MIIGVVGFKGSGKDAFGQHFVDQHSFKLESYANPLKDALASIMVWERDLLEGSTKESRAWRETPDQYWSKVFGKPVTPRWTMQHFGTEVVRGHFLADMWVESMRKRLLEAQERGEDVVVTDCRFPNEIALIRDLGGVVVRVRRGDEPRWWNIAVRANKGCPISKLLVRYWYKIHPSEFSWIGEKMDFTIENDSDLAGLNRKSDSLLQAIGV